ncbi:MAG: hypothetical protein V4467_02730 [Patescibacteria group bacterium]
MNSYNLLLLGIAATSLYIVFASRLEGRPNRIIPVGLGVLAQLFLVLLLGVHEKKEHLGLPAPETALEQKGFYKVTFAFRNRGSTSFDYLVGLQPLELNPGSKEFSPNGESKIYNLSRSVPASIVGHVVVANKDDTGVSLVDLSDLNSPQTTNAPAVELPATGKDLRTLEARRLGGPPRATLNE